MGSGKSTLGPKLAHALDFSWIDTDDLFTTRKRTSIAQFFKEEGDAAFREAEHQILLEISEMEQVVVSTGGGMPIYHGNMDLMNDTGITVYLQANPQLLLKRIQQSEQKRPLLMELRGEEAMKRIQIHLDFREPIYTQAKIIVDASKPDIDSVVKQIQAISERTT